jgi:hypothetical protein
VAKVEFHISAKVLQVLIPYFSWPLLLLNSLSLYPHKNIEVFSFLKIDCKTYYFVFFKLENIAAPIFCCYSNDQDVWSKIRFTLSISQINLATAVKYFKLENEMNGQIILNLLWNVLIQYWFKNPKTSSLKFLHP